MPDWVWFSIGIGMLVGFVALAGLIAAEAWGERRRNRRVTGRDEHEDGGGV